LQLPQSIVPVESYTCGNLRPAAVGVPSGNRRFQVLVIVILSPRHCQEWLHLVNRPEYYRVHGYQGSGPHGGLCGRQETNTRRAPAESASRG
jgi:hypothetical protein